MPAERVLVIDDELMIRWSIERMLCAGGYEVEVAETAARGLEIFREQSPRVVFLDVRLPDEDGLAVLRKMKQEHGEETAVIIMTAFGEPRTAAEAMELGAYQYLKKPFDFDALQGLVAKALETTRGIGTSGPH